MAVRTRTPSRGWSSVAPYSNYSNVVANYGAALINANREQKNNAIDILPWRSPIIQNTTIYYQMLVISW